MSQDTTTREMKACRRCETSSHHIGQDGFCDSCRFVLGLQMQFDDSLRAK